MKDYAQTCLTSPGAFYKTVRQIMANHKSAIKRHRQNEKRAEYNRWWKSRVKTAARTVADAVTAKDKDTASKALASAMKEIQKAKVKGILHKNAAARKISRLSKTVSSL